jgi:flagellar motor switch protein FliM
VNGAGPAIERLDLIAGSVGIATLEETGFAERRLAAAFDELLLRYGEPKDRVRETALRSAIFADWVKGHEADLVCRYSGRSSLHVHMMLPRVLFDGLFERYYGGAGDAGTVNEPSKAQLRFAQRIGHDLANVIAAGWQTLAEPAFELIGASFDRDELSATPGGLLILELHLAACTISLALPAELVASMRGRAPAPSAAPKSLQGEWRDRLIERASDVRLPVRSILARPEIPAARLLALKPGDVLPISMPASVPVTVGRRQFAYGALGETHGCAAIRVETIAKGPIA